MISYELAKQLKEGGFPQAGDGKWIGPADSLVWRSADRVYVPTLEELIGALGNYFYSLEQIGPQSGAPSPSRLKTSPSMTAPV